MGQPDNSRQPGRRYQKLPEQLRQVKLSFCAGRRLACQYGFVFGQWPEV